MLNIRRFLTAIGLVPVSSTGIDQKGEMEVLDASGKLNFHNGTTASPIVTEAHSSSLTNKTIDADLNTISNIDDGNIKASAGIDATKLADGTVSNTEFQYIGTLTSNAQDQIDAVVTSAGNANTAISNHLSDTVDAHDASAISNVPSGNLAATDVQGALDELQTDIDTRATSAALSAHTGASSSVHGVTGSVVGTSDSQALTNKTIVVASNTVTTAATGNLAATELNAALAELQGDIDNRQPLDSTLTALAGYNTNGLITQTAADTFTGRTLTGTANTITVTNGDGVAGNPTVTIANNAVLPGTDSVTVPKGTTAQRGASVTGKLRYNSDLDQFEGYTTAGGWGEIGGGGSGGINYIDSNNGSSTTGWVTYNTSETVLMQFATDIVQTTDPHGLEAGDPVSFDSITGPNGVTANTVYYVIPDGANTFKISTTPGGSVVNFLTSNENATLHRHKPTTGTGGVSNITWTSSTTTPLRGTTSFVLTKGAANYAGEGVSYEFSIDEADSAKPLTISFDARPISGTYVDGDVTCWVYDVSEGADVQPIPYKILTTGSVGTYSNTYTMEFQTSLGTDYRLIFHVSSASTTSYELQIDNISVGPTQKVAGPVVTDSTSVTLTPSAGFGTTTNGSFQEQRVGDKARYVGRFTCGTVAASTMSLALPSGRAIDTTKISTNASKIVVGHWYRALAGAGPGSSAPAGAVLFDGSTTGTVYFGYQTASGAFSTNTGSAGLTNSDVITFEFEVPIAGWSSNLVMSTNAETRVVAAKYFIASSVSGSTSAPFDFATKQIDTHNAVTTGANWKFTAPVAGHYAVGTTLATSSGTAVAALYKNGSQDSLVAEMNSTNYNGGFQIIQLNAGDYIDIRPTSAVSTNSSPAQAVSIHLIQGPAQIAASEIVAAAYTTNAAQSIPNTTITIVDFEDRTFDTHSSVTTGASWKFTAPAAGYYRVSARLLFTSSSAWATSEAGYLYVYKNGALYRCIERKDNESGTASPLFTLGGDCLVSMVAGDYIDVRVQQQSGGSLALDNTSEYNYVDVHRLGGR